MLSTYLSIAHIYYAESNRGEKKLPFHFLMINEKGLDIIINEVQTKTHTYILFSHNRSINKTLAHLMIRQYGKWIHAGLYMIGYGTGKIILKFPPFAQYLLTILSCP